MPIKMYEAHHNYVRINHPHIHRIFGKRKGYSYFRQVGEQLKLKVDTKSGTMKTRIER